MDDSLSNADKIRLLRDHLDGCDFELQVYVSIYEERILTRARKKIVIGMIQDIVADIFDSRRQLAELERTEERYLSSMPSFFCLNG